MVPAKYVSAAIQAPMTVHIMHTYKIVNVDSFKITILSVGPFVKTVASLVCWYSRLAVKNPAIVL